MEIILSALLGGFISWLITSIYSRSSRNDSEIIASRLSAEIRQLVLDSRENDLGVVRLNELLREKTESNKGLGVHRYIACPQCGTSNITKDWYNHTYTDYDEHVKLMQAHCNICGWHEKEDPEIDPYAYLRNRDA